MKKKNYLNDPIFKKAIQIHEEEVELALNIETNVANAIIPIALIPDSKGHKQKKTKPELVGSGVLVEIRGVYFVFSAKHVFEGFNAKVVYTGCPNNKFLEPLTGELFNSELGEDKIDVFDATVFHIKNNISDELKKTAITFSEMDNNIDDDFKERPIFIATGFRIKDSNLSKNELKTKISRFPTVELPDYSKHKYDCNTHLLLSFEDQILMDKQWKTSPRPRGMSGGAVIKAQGTMTNPFIRSEKRKEQKQLLSAIITEHYRDRKKISGYLVSTRITYHFYLILKFMPNFLD